ncbi:TonB-dependent receptor [Sphingomonas sp. CARO-RG-8B-R24-01]|uniref:TonB-dependent receptor n=1 Tax=Sphingomonas sp. CARO-RG-8B-R24-01 TaxID=2914831 RepID=UPI001F5AF9FA|nr:TonB-dependent receptor [Sphingomonas sp. CARO-RG-8B-R24-01]
MNQISLNSNRIYRRRLLASATSLIALSITQPALAQAGTATVQSTNTAQTSGPAQGGIETQPVPGTSPAAGAAASGASQADGSAATATSASDSGDILVIGVRGAQKAAVDLKRSAAQIVDSIVAEDIGKLPDTTIADSLQRVTGVQIDRTAGEGGGVNIRGLGQVLVTLNGESFLGGQSIDNAQPNFTDIPPTLFSGVDVFKSPTARQLEGGISGIIDLKTRRPFDLKRGITLSGSAQGEYGDRVKKLNSTYSALAGYHTDRFGLLVAGSYSKASLANIRIDTGNSWLVSTDALSGRDLRGNGRIGSTNIPANGDYVYQPAVVSASNQTTERERYGANASAQYKITDQLTLTADGAYTQLDDRTRAVNLQLNSGYAPRPLLAGSQVDSNGVVTVANFALPGFAENSLATNSKSRTFNTNLELNYNNGSNFKGTLRWVHADAKRDSVSSQADSKPETGNLLPRGIAPECQGNQNPDLLPASCYQLQNPNGFQAVNVGIDYTTKYPTLAFGTDVTNPANWELYSTWGYGDHRRAKNDAFRADGTFTFPGDGFFKTLDAGIRYNVRDVTVSEFKYLAPVTVPGIGTLAKPGDLYYFKDAGITQTGTPAIEGRSVLPIYTFGALGNRIKQYNSFIFGGVPSAGIPGIDPNAMSNPLAFQNSLFPGNAEYQDPTRSFRVKEKNASAYAQLNFASEQGIAGIGISGNIGLRFITTTRTVFANTTDPNRFIGTGGNYNGVFINLGTTANKKQIDRYLPAANLTFDLNRKMKLRLAAAKVVGELNLFDLGAGQVLYYGANNGRYPLPVPQNLQVFLSGASGNPNLEPYQSTNYNASYEFYFGRGGLFSAAAFLFDVKSFPQSIGLIQPIADQDGVVRAGGVVQTTSNGKGGKIKGVEVGYQQQFDFLPGFLSGFGANANFTYSDSQSSNVDLFNHQLPVPDNSKFQYNVIGFYQKGPIQARVAYNWRSTRFAGIQYVNGIDLTNAPNANALAIYSKPVGYLDASASYDILPNATIFVQGTNLTRSNDEEYLQFKNQFYQQNVFERRLTVGVRIRN